MQYNYGQWRTAMVNIRRATARQLARIAKSTNGETPLQGVAAYKALRSAPLMLQIKAGYRASITPDPALITDYVTMPCDNVIGKLSLYLY